jgi:ribosomal-protein-serine acetyltransferase
MPRCAAPYSLSPLPLLPPISLTVPPDIEVRTAVLADAEAFLALVTRNRAHLGRYLPKVVTLDTREKVEQHLSYPATTLEIEVIDLHLFCAGTLCGALRLNHFEHENRKASLAYLLDAGHQGRGIVTRAARALLAHAFEAMGLHRVELTCVTDNAASVAVAERLGFTREGRLRDAEQLDGRFVDHFVYGLLSGELG